MKVLVDTSVWSLALRRKKDSHHPYVLELNELVRERRVQMIGPIRQEILSGIRVQSQFETLKDHLSAFPDLSLTKEDYERAAEFFNIRSNTDFLICAISERYGMPILITDGDFEKFQKHIPIKLHLPRFKRS